MSSRLPSSAVNQKTFNRLLSLAWDNSHNRARMGIALSGGQDSMALTALCENYRKAHRNRNFTAFIVDHAVRKESRDEAQWVRDTVKTKTGIDVQILTLTWYSHLHPLQLLNFESIARRLRYRALAKACFDLDINTLLVAHHADDQAETVLSRMAANYLGTGLAGIQRNAPIPECDDLYGSNSGRPTKISLAPMSGFSLTEQSAWMEGGGVNLHRPLLGSTKESLKATCIANDFPWAEDKTNTDRTLGPRNAIRHLMVNGRLPKALGVAPLRRLAKERRIASDAISEEVEEIFRACAISLNPLNGTVDIQFPPEIKELLFKGSSPGDDNLQARHRAAVLLRKIILLVSPLNGFTLPDCRGPSEIVFSFLFSEAEHYTSEHDKVATAAKVLCRIVSPTFDFKHSPSSSIRCHFSRTPPSQQDRIEQAKVLIYEPTTRAQSVDFAFTPMTLFDGRYWIRVSYRLFNLSPGHRISVRFLEEPDLEQVRSDSSIASQWTKLQQLLREKAPGKIRYTLPAIVQTSHIAENSGKKVLRSKLLALPTLGWSSTGWAEYDKSKPQEAWAWTIRYKKIDYAIGLKHRFVG